MPAKKTPATKLQAPTALEIATLATRFLPTIDLPDEWETFTPHRLGLHVGQANKALQTGFRTPWEVICNEATQRARVLLDAVDGRTRDTVAASDAKAEAFWRTMRESEKTATAIIAKNLAAFDKKLRTPVEERENPGTQYPLTAVLESCSKVNAKVIKAVLARPEIQAALRNLIGVDPAAGAAADGIQVKRAHVGGFVAIVRAAIATHGEAAKKRLSREAGRRSQKSAEKKAEIERESRTLRGTGTTRTPRY